MYVFSPHNCVYAPIEEATGQHPPGDTLLFDLHIPGFGSGDVAKFFVIECAAADLRLELSDAECEAVATIDDLIALLARREAEPRAAA